VEVSGQLSNQAMRERINALWSLTRDNVLDNVLGAQLTGVRTGPANAETSLPALDPAKVEELIHGYVDGVPVDELAARFQVDQGTVQKHARRHSLPRRSPRLGPRQSEEAARLYLAGQSLAKLANHFGVY
jgi:hypothetical protein